MDAHRRYISVHLVTTEEKHTFLSGVPSLSVFFSFSFFQVGYGFYI